MHELGDLLSEEEIVSFMEVMDVNNDGFIGVSQASHTRLLCDVGTIIWGQHGHVFSIPYFWDMSFGRS